MALKQKVLNMYLPDLVIYGKGITQTISSASKV